VDDDEFAAQSFAHRLLVALLFRRAVSRSEAHFCLHLFVANSEVGPVSAAHQLGRPGVAQILRKTDYGRLLGKRGEFQVLREHAFALREEGKLMSGSIDRLVLVREGERVVAAEVIDFKTDMLDKKSSTLADKVEFYRPQLAAYRRAVARLHRLDEAAITARLVFLSTGETAIV
jgi:ATP-dependent exoDNAse (exonuclease V) beta subunit